MLENVSHDNEENCSYLINHNEAGVRFVDVMSQLFSLLDSEIPLNPSKESSGELSLATSADLEFACVI